MPTNPEPGKCYVKCVTPNEFSEEDVVIEISPAYKTLKTFPATYKTIEERIMVKEASKQLVYVPAVYETINVDYVGKEFGSELIVNAATFGEDSKTVDVYPSTTGWEYTVDPDCSSANPNDCIVACFKEYPSRSESLKLKTLVKDAFTTEKKTPDVKSSYNKQVIKTPARMNEIEIPAQYSVIKKQVVDKPARTEEVIVPAVTKVVKKTVLVKAGGMTVWEELDCNLLEPTILPILYPLNSALLTPEAKRVIDENLLDFMRQKPLIKIELASHTDSRGSDEYNMSLSQQRAQSVVNYLASKGINKNRLMAKGYGETRLKNKCANGVECSEEEHQVNRRTEFRVIQ